MQTKREYFILQIIRNVRCEHVHSGEHHQRTYQESGNRDDSQLALGFNMTIAEFCDFEEMNMYEFVEEESEVAG